MMIDEISFKIMTELCKDGRSSNAEIAQKLGVSESMVTKKVRAMLQNGVINIKALPNPVRIGYTANALIGLSIDSGEIDNIFGRIKRNPHVNLAINCFGRFDFLLLVYFNDKGLLHSFLKEDLHIKGIKSIETYFVSEEKKLFEGIFKNNRNDTHDELDETDEKLIRALMQNGRVRYSVLADDLSISISTISKRIEFLIRENFIKIIGIPNPAKLGYSVDAFILVKCALDRIDSVCSKLGSFSEINMILTLMNGYDIMFSMHSLNPESLSMFLQNNITTIDGVLHTETFIRGNYLYLNLDAMFLADKNL